MKRFLVVVILLSIISLYLGCANKNLRRQGINDKSNATSAQVVDTKRNDNKTARTDDTHSTSMPDEKKLDTRFGIEVGKKYKIRGRFVLKSRPAKVDSSLQATYTNDNEEYTVVNIKGAYANIKKDDKEGWIPLWYLTEQTSKIIEIKPVNKIIKKESTLYIFPIDINPDDNPDIDKDLTLFEGSVVRVIREYEDWYNVVFVQYEAGNWGDRWIKKDSVEEFSPEKSKEGIVRKGAPIYDDKFNVLKGISYDNGRAKIQSEIITENMDAFYYISGVAGFNGYIKKSDFIPNPFYEDNDN